MRTCIILIAAAAFGQNVGTNVEQPVIDYYDSISDYYKTNRRTVDAIAKKGVPAEEIPAVLHIARESSAAPEKIVDARKAGKSFAEIARENKVTIDGTDFVKEANVMFLAEYHGRTPAQVRDLLGKGVTFIDINQQYRRVGRKPATPR